MFVRRFLEYAFKLSVIERWKQVNVLSKFLTVNFPGESQNEGAVDCAVRIIQWQDNKLAHFKAGFGVVVKQSERQQARIKDLEKIVELADEFLSRTDFWGSLDCFPAEYDTLFDAIHPAGRISKWVLENEDGVERGEFTTEEAAWKQIDDEITVLLLQGGTLTVGIDADEIRRSFDNEGAKAAKDLREYTWKPKAKE